MMMIVLQIACCPEWGWRLTDAAWNNHPDIYIVKYCDQMNEMEMKGQKADNCSLTSYLLLIALPEAVPVASLCEYKVV